SVWKAYLNLPSVNAQAFRGGYFTIDLQSDAVLIAADGWQRSMVLTAEMLKQMAGCDAHLELVRSFASYDYVSGWNAAQKLRKGTELLTNMGSVFVFRADDIALWEKPLEDLEVSGIGNRREEGFGQILVCHPFHLRTQSDLQKQIHKEETNERNEGI
ncbi:MAG: hypothetical protein O7E52_13820, partial [Candidatus Poribacteria bacterium]|nr:hypothetical protein [Candidatus Poribacteria bacterium]